MALDDHGRNEMSIKGELLYLTNSPRLSWLNNTKAYVEGVTDTRKGETSVKIYALTEAPRSSSTSNVKREKAK